MEFIINRVYFNFNNLDSSIKHLKKIEISQMIERYYQKEPVKNLIKEYSINIENNLLVKRFPQFSFGECPICNYLYWRTLPARGELLENRLWDIFKEPCKKCSHSRDYMDCGCDSEVCKTIRSNQWGSFKEVKAVAKGLLEEFHLKEKIINKIRNEIVESCSLDNKIEETSLTLQQKLYLGLFIKVSQQDESDELLIPVNQTVQITPTPEFFSQIIDYLVEEKIILPSVNSPITAFTFSEDYQISFDQYNVTYIVNVEPHDGDYNRMIQRLVYSKPEDFLEDKDFCFEIWHKVALGEVLDYFYYKLGKVGFGNTHKKIYFQVFGRLLDYFSVVQIYRII